uniref:Oligomycin sensitivity conferral protein n=3 Tax=Meloidogyne incognita group TaxID=654580 RepID=A0A915ME81_MELJA
MLTNSVNFLFKRSFAISASALQVIRPPVQVSGIEGKYASALYSSGMKEKSLDKIEKDLSQLKVLYDTNNDFKLFVENPILNKQKKADAIQAVLKNQGMSKTVQNFFVLLTESGRLVKLSSIINSFETIMRAHRNELQVEVTSAEPLNKKQEQSLRSALASFANAGQELNISFGVKPSLIGGMVVTIDDKYVDLSMASKIKKMEALLEKSI